MRADSDPAQPHLGEPNCTEAMTLQPSGGSVTVAIPAAAVKVLGYEVGESREVEVYDDGVFIPKEAPDE